MRILVALADAAARRALFRGFLAVDLFSDGVGDGQHALQKLEERSYGVVLLDLDLENDGADDVLAWVAAMPAKARPFVFVIGDAGRQTLDSEVVQIVLRKTLRVDQTVELVENCIRTLLSKLPPSDSAGPSHADHLTRRR